jgi:hypothetical protein
MIKGTHQDYIALYRIFLICGIIFLIAGIILGLQVRNPSNMNVNEYLHLSLLTTMNQQSYYHFYGIPEFLIRGTTGNMFYGLGAGLMIISVSFYFIDLKEKENHFIRMMIYYGKISLSLFLIHFIFATLYLRHLNVVVFLFAIISYIGFLGFFMYIWNEYADGVGSPEWIMIQFSRVGEKAGDSVKREMRKTETLIRNFTQMFALRRKTKLEKMEDLIEAEKQKRLKKIEKKERKKHVKEVHKQMGFDKKGGD